MIHPKRDFIIALSLFFIGLAAAIWGLPSLADDSLRAKSVALVIGGLMALFGLIFSFNFGVALRIKWRLEKGTDAIARWNIPPAQLNLYIQTEAQRAGQHPHWQPNHHDKEFGINVAFGPESVLLGGLLYSIPSSGLQSIRAVKVYLDQPPVIEFQTQLYETRGATVQTLRVSKGLLRVPAPDEAQALSVCNYYQDIITGKHIVAPNRWTIRIKIGLATIGVSVLMIVASRVMSELSGGKPFGPNLSLEEFLLVVGIMGILFGSILSFAAWRLYLRQRGVS